MATQIARADRRWILAGALLLVWFPASLAADTPPRIPVRVIVVQSQIGDRSVRISGTPNPATIPGEDGGSSSIEITVKDKNNAAVENQAVFFKTNLGSFDHAFASTDAMGKATVTLTVPRVGAVSTATVTAIPVPVYLPSQPKGLHSALVGIKNQTISDKDFADEIRKALTDDDGKPAVLSAIFLFQQCFSGGMLDDLRGEIGDTFPWIGGSAASYFQLSWSEGTAVDALNKQLEQVKKLTEQFENKQDLFSKRALLNLNLQRDQLESLLRAARTRPQPFPGGDPHGHWTRALVQELRRSPPTAMLDALLNAQQRDPVGFASQQNLEWGNHFPNPSGVDITLGDPKAGRLFVILWGGAADIMAHFHDIDQVEKAIRDRAQAQRKPVNITILFGDGQTKPKPDGTALPWPAKEATKDELVKAIRALKGKITKDDQFIFYASDHGTYFQDPPQLATANSPDRSVFTIAPLVLQGMLLTGGNAPTISVRHRNVASPNLGVRVNGVMLGHLDPSLETTTFPIPEEFLGTCVIVEIQSTDPAESYEYEAEVTFSPGGLTPVFIDGAQLPPAEACPDFVTLLSPFSAINPVGTEHTVTARLVGDDGTPLAGRPVTFRVVSGPHADETGTGTTDGNGIASFTYAGRGIGVDQIRASFQDLLGVTQSTNSALSEWTRLSSVTAFTGSASRIGIAPPPGQDAGAQVGIGMRFVLAGPIDLASSTVAITRLLYEPGGAGELTEGTDGADLLPILLIRRSGSTRTAAIFETPSGMIPGVRLQIRNRSQGLFDFTLKVDRATIPVFPRRCGQDGPGTTGLATNFTIDDGVNPVVAVSTTRRWRCLDLSGGDPGRPRSLRSP